MNHAEYQAKWRKANLERSKELVRASVKKHHVKYNQTRKPKVREKYNNDPVFYFKRKEYGLKRRYGLNMGDYDRLLTSQNGGCAICSIAPVPNKKILLGVDHNHSTGKVRGLLCNNCNTALGFVKENVVTLRKMVEYLTIHVK